MLIGLVRACRRGAAGIAWLIDYTVAVALSAWDGVGVSQRAARKSPPEPVIDFTGTPQAPSRVLFHPGRAAASLAVIGVLSVSLFGALWRQPAASDVPGVVATITSTAGLDAEPSETSVLLWAPLIADEEPAPLPVEETPPVETAEPTPEPASSPEPTPADSAPVAAAAVDTPAPEPTSEPAPAMVETPEPEPAAPQPAPAATVSVQLTKAQVREIALQVGWPEGEVEELLSVAWCESHYRVDANGWGALGLMQIMPFWFESLGIDVSLAFDAATNLRVAYHIYQNDLRNGYLEWASWTCKPVGVHAAAQ